MLPCGILRCSIIPSFYGHGSWTLMNLLSWKILWSGRSFADYLSSWLQFHWFICWFDRVPYEGWLPPPPLQIVLPVHYSPQRNSLLLLLVILVLWASMEDLPMSCCRVKVICLEFLIRSRSAVRIQICRSSLRLHQISEGQHLPLHMILGIMWIHLDVRKSIRLYCLLTK